MPEDRTPRVTSTTESIPDSDESPTSRRRAHRESDSRTGENEKRESSAKKRQSRVDMDGPTGTDVEDDLSRNKDRVHFPLFP